MSEAKRVTVGDLEMNYFEAGSGDRAFVLVHGFTGSSDDFSDVLPHLAEHGRTLTLDNRGHGGTTNAGRGYDLDTMAGDLGGFLDAVGVDRCDLLGHSLGGMISLRFVLAHPDRVASLILMDTAPRALDLLPIQIFEAGAKIGREQGMAAVYERMGAGGLSSNVEPGSPRALSAERMGQGRYHARIERKILAMDPEAFEGCARSLGEQIPVDDRLHKIACPTTVVVGDQDEPFLQPSRDLAAGIPKAVLEIVPDAMHSPQLENETAWLAAIGGHLARARG